MSCSKKTLLTILYSKLFLNAKLVHESSTPPPRICRLIIASILVMQFATPLCKTYMEKINKIKITMRI